MSKHTTTNAAVAMQTAIDPREALGCNALGGRGAKHTPGPWNFQAGRVYTSGGCTIAEPPIRDNDLLADGAMEEQDANSRLIAAAPELLALVRAWLLCDPHGTHSDACRAIIDKATA